MATIWWMMKRVFVMMCLVKWVVGRYGNEEVDVLMKFKQSLEDPSNALITWDPSLVDPCTFFHITCDGENHVTRIDLGRYSLTGKLAPDLGKLEHLEYLELYGNKFQGSIPPELGNLANLRSLDLYENDISGIIPPELGKLNSLVFMRLSENKLQGPIPQELTNLSNLRVLNVTSNDLCGPIPTTGPFANFPPENFRNNPRLGGAAC
ncbi:hypothetical protein vseg_012371 [Gypsophila vaccaria]